MHILSPLLCPNCGHQELWHIPATEVYTCNKCWKTYLITIWFANKPAPVIEEPTPLLDMIDDLILDAKTLAGDKGVTL